MNISEMFIFTVSLIFCECLLVQYLDKQVIPEDGNLNFTGVATKYGQSVQEYDVITEDGYVLKMFRIPGNKDLPVLLVHGIIDSADTFILRGRTSLAATLSAAGYDVWAVNTRGNRYSRRHTTLDPDSEDFWNFSMHEIGYYDLPATIDFILTSTGQRKLSAIAHSNGNTVFYILGSMRPEYNEKITVLVALAPVCFLHNTKPPISELVKASPVLNRILSALGQEEVFNDRSIIRSFLELVCTKPGIGYELCVKRGFFVLAGFDVDEFEPEFLPVVLGHYPTSTSRKNLVHLGQVAFRKSFAQFDYGARNMEVYKLKTPPEYDMSQVTMRVALFAAKNDYISTLKDVAVLRRKLPNAEYLVMERKSFNHIDHVWGRNMGKYLFPRIFEMLKKYS